MLKCVGNNVLVFLPSSVFFLKKETQLKNATSTGYLSYKMAARR